MGVTSERLIAEFAGNLLDLDKTTSPIRVVDITKKIAILREKMMQDVIPVGISSFTITYSASREGLPEFYLERKLLVGETYKLDLLMLTQLRRIFQHYFDFTHLIIGPQNIMLVFELTRYV